MIDRFRQSAFRFCKKTVVAYLEIEMVDAAFNGELYTVDVLKGLIDRVNKLELE